MLLNITHYCSLLCFVVNVFVNWGSRWCLICASFCTKVINEIQRSLGLRPNYTVEDIEHPLPRLFSFFWLLVDKSQCRNLLFSLISNKGIVGGFFYTFMSLMKSRRPVFITACFLMRTVLTYRA